MSVKQEIGYVLLQVEKTLSSLLELYSSSIKLVATLKRSTISKDIKSSCQEYYWQVENLREFIYDLENFRSDDSGIDKLLSQINNI